MRIYAALANAPPPEIPTEAPKRPIEEPVENGEDVKRARLTEAPTAQ